MSEDLSDFEKVEPIMTYVRFEDADGNEFVGWLEMDQKDFKRAKERTDCPKNKSSMAYYEFLRDKAEALPCSPDPRNAPLIKYDSNGNVLAVYLYGVNAEGCCDFRPASKETCHALEKHSRTYFITAFLWDMHAKSALKLLCAPK